jgi:hypothetical protein
MTYDTQDYWISGLHPSSVILNEHVLESRSQSSSDRD